MAQCIVHLPYLDGNGQAPCMENIGIRHTLYKHYWKLMDNVGGWVDPRYTAKKARTAGGCELAIGSRREIMPMCIVKKLRGLFPNPDSVPYVGHRW